MEMTVSHAQSDMRRGYYSGAAGILASALAWTAAAVTAALVSPQKAIQQYTEVRPMTAAHSSTGTTAEARNTGAGWRHSARST